MEFVSGKRFLHFLLFTTIEIKHKLTGKKFLGIRKNKLDKSKNIFRNVTYLGSIWIKLIVAETEN